MRIYSTLLSLSSSLLQGASGQRAKVYIDGVLKAESDADGKYELSDMSTGKCRVTVSMVMSVTKACTYVHTYVLVTVLRIGRSWLLCCRKLCTVCTFVRAYVIGQYNV